MKRKALMIGVALCSADVTRGPLRSSCAFIEVPRHRTRTFISNRIRVCRLCSYDAVATRMSRTRKGSVIAYKSGPGYDDNDGRPLSTGGGPLSPEEMSTKLLTYASNIRRVRSDRTTMKTRKSTGGRSISAGSATHSLIHLLKSESTAHWEAIHLCSESNNLPNLLPSAPKTIELRQSLSKACVSAIRSAADGGDYGLISRIVDAAVHYARAFAESTDVAILDCRVFGEALSGLDRSSASQSKLKKLWDSFIDLSSISCKGRQIMTSSPGPQELNSLLSGLAKRKRVRSALDLYRSSGISGDAFTASILLEMLAASIPTSRQTGGVTGGRKAPTTANDACGLNHIYEEAKSSCWQWNEALSIVNDIGKGGELNNYVFSSALKVNKHASRLFGDSGRRRNSPHDGGKSALFLLELMVEFQITPDSVTCTSILQALEAAGYWKEATEFLESMECIEKVDIISLPLPNIYSYTSAVCACLSCGEEEEGMKILDRLMSSPSPGVTPKTWVYNRSLQALMNAKHVPYNTLNQGGDNRFEVAGEILKRMKDGNADISPDTITYNIILSGMKLRAASNEYVVFHILSQMVSDGVKRDFITFRNAISACWDFPFIATAVIHENPEKPDNLDDLKRLSKVEKTKLLNILLDVCGDSKNVTCAANAFNRMVQLGATPDVMTYAEMASLFANTGDGEGLVLLFKTLTQNEIGADLFERYGFDILSCTNECSFQLFEVKNLAASAIESLLAKDNLPGAMTVLSSMRRCGIEVREDSLLSIASEHCRLGMISASTEFKEERKESMQRCTKSFLLRPIQHMSSSYAGVALEIAKKMDAPPVSLYCDLIKACYASGRCSDGRTVLKQAHQFALREAKSGGIGNQGSFSSALPHLHHQLFKLCARSGNVTSALWVSDAVVDLSHEVESKRLESNLTITESQSIIVRAKDMVPSRSLGMCGEDWKLLMISASKSGHWRVCVSTLHLLQPFVESTNIGTALSRNVSLEEADIRKLNRDYHSLSRALTAAALCFEIRSQYAWAMRAIEDFIEWSGRRPPTEAVAAACRILAKRGKGQQVISIISRILQVPPSDMNDGDDSNYKFLIYNHAIAALYKNGLYDRADELYASGVRNAVLPWAPIDTSDNISTLKLDLHGMTAAVAHSAVRVTLQREIQNLTWNTTNCASGRDVIIITGRGKRSERQFRPVVRPEVQRMLVEEFYPPLGTASVPGNMGALQISADAIQAWLEHQKEQKELRMLSLAAVLKGLSPERIAPKIVAIAKSEADSGDASSSDSK